MQQKQISDNLVQLTRLKFVNAYLVREADGLTLVDTTVPGSADKLIDAARQAGGAITRIALTHGHSDHVGSLDALKERLDDAVQVFIPEVDARLLGGDKVVDGKKVRGFPTIKTAPDVRLSEGDRVGSLQVVESPGHSPGHVAFLDTRDDTLIAGDAYATLAGVQVPSHVYWRFPLPAMATWSKPTAIESAKKLRALDPRLLAVGHGATISNPGAEMDRGIAAAERAAGEPAAV